MPLFNIYQLTKIYSKIHPVSCTYTHHNVTDLVNHGMVKNTKKLEYLESGRFLWNKKILNLCFRWHILRSYRFAAKITFKALFNTVIFIFQESKMQLVSLDILKRFFLSKMSWFLKHANVACSTVFCFVIIQSNWLSLWRSGSQSLLLHIQFRNVLKA